MSKARRVRVKGYSYSAHGKRVHVKGHMRKK